MRACVRACGRVFVIDVTEMKPDKNTFRSSISLHSFAHFYLQICQAHTCCACTSAAAEHHI